MSQTPVRHRQERPVGEMTLPAPASLDRLLQPADYLDELAGTVQRGPERDQDIGLAGSAGPMGSGLGQPDGDAPYR